MLAILAVRVNLEDLSDQFFQDFPVHRKDNLKKNYAECFNLKNKPKQKSSKFGIALRGAFSPGVPSSPGEPSRPG